MRRGDIVDVFSSNNEFLAKGHYQIGSIAVRIFSFVETIPDFEFWLNKINNAYKARQEIHLGNNTNVYRLVNGEGDGFPGLIIDYYHGICIMQMHSIGMYRIRELLVEALKTIYGQNLKAVYDKSQSTIPYKSGIEPIDGYIWGSAEPAIVRENGFQFLIDWEEGQKTGFFIDQRENRELLKKFSVNRNVLNMFAYTGGFSVYAMGGGAALVHSVDSSAKAMATLDKNIELNFAGSRNHASFCTDAFTFLNNMESNYDLIVLDPPAFAKHLNVLDNALQGYKRLNQKALEKIKPGGILFTFSCSQVVSKENFRKSVFAAAANSSRNVQILYQLTQPPDHPVSIYHPEGEYLKGLVLRVE
ncbi:MAG: class I SAM-dependent rRNA methyltransferase [Bacteroidales bacterium]|nr:class I SAM-dependent rRNA methyltransferase [Bacteroidales bacterium]